MKKEFDKYYKTGEELGRGNFSIVYDAVRRKDGVVEAVKVVDKGEVDEDKLMREIDILKQVSHPNIINLTDVFETDEKLYIVMEKLTGGELFNKLVEIGSYSEDTAKEITRQILDAVRYLHDLNIAHRDLKPTNLLLREGDKADIKITDFGLSRMVGDNSIMQTACGTPIYVAPEVLTGEGYEKEVDLWSIGVIMYILLCGFPPFFDEEDNMAALFDQILSGEFTFPSPYWDDISEDAKDLITRLLQVEPDERLSASDALKHKWFARKPKKSKLLSKFKEKFSEFHLKK